MKKENKVKASINKGKSSEKRTQEKREEHLVKIAMLAIANPLTAKNIHTFTPLVCKKIGLTKDQAKRDILEVRKREKQQLELNSKEEFLKKIKEYTLIKEVALKQKNLNAYLGAVKAESQLLGLEKLNIFIEKKDNSADSLKEKKELFLKMIENKDMEDIE